MADIEGGGSSHKKGAKKIRSKKQSTRVDFTPMVDLGFLLITFFMLTTSMNKPQTMEINMPVKDKVEEEDQTKIKASQAMTVLLVENHKIVYYFGIEDPKLERTDFSADGIRKILLKENRDRNAKVDSIPIYRSQFQNKLITEEQYKKHVRDIKAYKDGLIVVIKAHDDSKYKDLVDILDEMQICNIGRYAIVDISDVEKEMLSKL
jgi:biopolymer transport protein ExbD